MGVVTYLADGLRNALSRLGTADDKFSSSRYHFTPLSDADLIYAYRGAWLPKKVIDVPALDSVREWRQWMGGDLDHIEAIEAEERRLNLKGAVKEARVMARLFGGSAIYIGTTDRDLSLPLVIDDKGRDSITHINVLSRHECTPEAVSFDPTSPDLGQPEFFQLSNGGRVHRSRLIRFVGVDNPTRRLEATPLSYWGDSVLQSVYDQVRQADSTSANVASLVFEAKVDVYKIPEFMARIGDEEYQKRVQERVHLANVAKGNLAALLMDVEEDYEQKQYNFAGLRDLLLTFMELCSGAADIPVTRLLGQSPGGLNSTGESDLRNYYDSIGSEQELSIGPSMKDFDRLLVRSATGEDNADIYYEWNPLWKLSDKERSSISKEAADTVKVIAESGLIPDEPLAEAAASFLVERGALPGLSAAMESWAGELGDPDDEGLELEEREEGLEGESEPGAIEAGDRAFKDATPRTLYVSRRVLNAGEILEWARSQGIGGLFEEEELHVTVAYSRSEIDWMKVPDCWSGDEDGARVIRPGGPRLVDRLGGDDGYTALLFVDSELSWRHVEIRRAGASWDWEEYQPHISLSRTWRGNIDEVEPYTGRIVLGPEIFEELEED